MKKLDDLKLLDKYIDKYKLNDCFSTFHMLKKELVQYEKGEFLLMAGDELTHLLFCVDGRIEIYDLSKNGNDFTFAYCDDLSLLGDVEFLSDIPTPNYVQAISDVLCIAIPIEANREFLEKDISLYKYLGKSIVKKTILELNEDLKYQHLPSIERLKHYLRIIAQDKIIDRNLNELARSLNISYRQLMRHLSALCQSGYLSKGEKRGTYKLNQ